MPVWESGDLVITTYAPSPNRNPMISAWSMPDGIYRGSVSLSGPLPQSTGFAPFNISIQPDNALLWGKTTNNIATAWNRKVVYSNGEPGDLHVERDGGVEIYNMSFDALGRRYMGDEVNSWFVIRRVNLDNTEELFYIWSNSTQNPVVEAAALGAYRLHVRQDGTRVYHSNAAQFPFNPSSVEAFNKHNMETGFPEHFFNLQDYVPSASSLGDIVLGPTTNYVYMVVELNVGPFVFVVDPETDSIVNWYQAGNNNCLIGALAMNCNETLLAMTHEEPGVTNIEVLDPYTGQVLVTVDYLGNTGNPFLAGMCFAQCPVLVKYPGIARVPRIGTTQDLFVRTTP